MVGSSIATRRCRSLMQPDGRPYGQGNKQQPTRRYVEMSAVLMVLTGSTVWTMKDGTPHPTGFWAEEFTRPHKTFSDAGLKVTIATPRGRTPVVDPLSLALPFNGN